VSYELFASCSKELRAEMVTVGVREVDRNGTTLSILRLFFDHAVRT